MLTREEDVHYHVQMTDGAPKNIIPISEARRRIFDIADEVQKAGAYFTLTENGRARAVVMSAEEFSSWMETVAVMSDTAAMRDIQEAAREYRHKNYVALETVLMKRTSVVKDGSGRSYASSRPSKTGGKSARKDR